MKTTHYDVIVSGGGMVGLMAAFSLSQTHERVLLVEQGKKINWDNDQERQLRVSAMAEKHVQWFQQLGIYQYFDDNRLGHYSHMSVWDNRSNAELNFSQPQAQLGIMVENSHVIHAATVAINNTPQVDIFYESEIVSFEDVGRQVRLNLSSGEKLTSRLLVAAEGAASAVRGQSGIEVSQSSYQQHGMVCYVRLDKAEQETAFQAFNPTGPVGLLPMGGGIFSIVWSMDESEVQSWLHCDETVFEKGLKAHINRDLGTPKLLSTRVAFPLRKQQACHYTKGRVVLMGDAAHVVHPLAGQGANLGLSDAAYLTELLSNVSLKDTEALLRSLKKYQRVRKSKVAESILMIDTIHHLFTKQQPPLPLVRATGMNLINRINPLKTWLMSQAGS